MTGLTGKRERTATADRGSALVELIVLGIAVLVPIAYLVLAVANVQSAAFASAQAVREAGRAFASAATPRDAAHRAVVAARLALADQGFVLPADALHLSCARGSCLSPGSVVDVRLTWEVPLPWLPASVGEHALAIPIEAAQLVPIDDFRSNA